MQINFFCDIDPSVLLRFFFRSMCVTWTWTKDLLYRHFFLWMSRFLLLLVRRCQLNGRRSTSFRYRRSEGEWKRTRTIVQVGKREEEKDTSTDSQVAIFAVLLSSSWLVCFRRKKVREREQARKTERKGYHHSQGSIFYRSHHLSSWCFCLRNRIV
jgi:hypothetical protein